MVGVGALGLYAIYRLVQTPKPSEEHITPMIPTREPPTPVIVPPGTLPDQPGAMPTPPADIAVVQGPVLQLTPGSWYHGRIETMNDAREKVQQDLQTLGFGNISVFQTPQEAATDIFQPFALANPGRGTRWFRARFPAFLPDGNATNPNVPRLPGLVVIWRAAPPRMAMNISGAFPYRSLPARYQALRDSPFTRRYRRPYW